MSHENRHTYDIDYDGILSCDCSYVEDSSMKLMGLSTDTKDKQNLISM